MAYSKEHTAFALPYNEVSEFTSEGILNTLVNNEFFLISTLLPYAKRPVPPRQ